METALADLHMTNTPDMPTRETCGAWLALRREIIELQDLKRKVQVRADGQGSVGPEGRGKRSHKGKVGVAGISSACHSHLRITSFDKASQYEPLIDIHHPLLIS